MLNFFKSNDFGSLRKELMKNYLNESKIQKIIDSGVDINQTDDNGRNLLFELSKKKRIEAIKILIRNGMNINDTDKYGKTVLADTISREDSLMIKFLLEQGADLNYKDEMGRSLLQDIALEGSLKIFRVCLQYNPDLNAQDKYGRTVLFDAVAGGSIEILQEILNNIDDPNILDQNGQTVLFEAVLNDNHELAKMLISYGVDVHISDKNRRNVMFNAVLLGAKNIDIIELLLRKGAKINQKDIKGKTILDEILYIQKIINDPYKKVEGIYKYAKKSNNYIALMSVLMAHGLAIDRTDDYGRTILFKEVLKENYEAVEFLIDTGADVNATDNDERTVLFYVIMDGLNGLSMIDFLIQKGADINHRDINGRTIVDDIVEFILVTQSNKKPTTKRLLKVQEKNEDYLGLLRKLFLRKPKLNEKRKDGRTVIFDVVLHDNINLLKLLLNNGADPNVKDEDLNTPFSLLVEHGVKAKTPKERDLFIERLVFLLKFRIDINAVDINGRTIFHKAVIANDVAVIERLLSKRADLNIKDKQGRTALHHTQWKGNAKIARLLIAAGANMDEPDYAGFTVLNYAAILGHRDLVIQLINSGVLMYNHNRKSKKVAMFFKEKFSNLDSLLTSDITDPKLRDSLNQVITNLKNEVLEVLNG